MKTTTWTTGLVTLLLLSLASCQSAPEEKEKKVSGAGIAMSDFAFVRMFPGNTFETARLTEAFEQREIAAAQRNGEFDEEWEPLGPGNIGGRTLCLAFHPSDPNIMFVGSASGGLWKSTSAGQGVEGWSYVPTGFPVLGVGAIAINPDNPDVMYIGTGEVYNYEAAMPGIINRTTRGSYGVGILKTTDGGATWEKSLDWSYTDMTGVQDIVIDPSNPNTVYAGTTEGVYRSLNAGADWENILDLSTCADIAMSPVDPSTILVSMGGYNSPGNGIFRSTNGGDSFVEVDGIPNFTGKTRMNFSESSPNVVYASVANDFEGIGLFRSTNGDVNWSFINGANVQTYQGWYSHDVAVKPDNPDYIIYTGIDAYTSANGGAGLSQRTYWYLWNFAEIVPVGGNEGPPDFVHADIHGAFWSPYDNEEVWLVTDGGMYVSYDAGVSWESRNGSYQTTQFYANFSNSNQSPDIGIGGLQDNSTTLYYGDKAWGRAIGGDGMCTGIDPVNDNILYGSVQRLNLYKSTNGGEDFNNISIPQASQEDKNFNGPFEVANTDGMVLYAGAQRLFKSTNGGFSWQATTENFIDGGNTVLDITIDPNDENHVYVSTSPTANNSPKVMQSYDGGATWDIMEGLPNAIAIDIAIAPDNPDNAYIVFGGLDNENVFRTLDGGDTWENIENGLPDLPCLTIAVDPLYPEILYLGNDLGVYVSQNGGEDWAAFCNRLPDAVIALHISFSITDRKVRVATHGSGVWQADMVEPVSSTPDLVQTKTQLVDQLYPNPVQDISQLALQLPATGTLNLQVFSTDGRLTKTLGQHRLSQGAHTLDLALGDLSSGLHYLQVTLSTEGGILQDQVAIRKP